MRVKQVGFADGSHGGRMKTQHALISLLALSAHGFLTSSALAFVAPEEDANKSFSGNAAGLHVLHVDQVPAHSIALPILTNAKSLDAEASFTQDAHNGVVRLVQGTNLAETLSFGDGVEAFAAAAQQFIADNHEIFGLNPSEVTLDHQALLFSKSEQFLKFRVQRDGLDVADASLDFRFKFGRLVQVINRGFAEAKSDNSSSRSGLEKAARAALIDADTAFTRELYRVRFDKNQGYHLVRVAEYHAKAHDGSEYMVQVEAGSAKVFELRPLTLHLDGTAKGSIYPRTYRDSSEIIGLPFAKLAYSGGSTTTTVDGRFSGAPNTAKPRLNGFEGAKVKVNPKTGDVVTQEGGQVRDGWQVLWERDSQTPAADDPDQAQAMVYYHTNRIIALAKQYLPNTTWLDRQLTANVNLSSSCNAHWDGTTINLYSAGRGCANTGLIADVTYHEWGHGLDHNTGGIEDGAFSEGFGDIMSMIITYSAELGVGFKTDGSPVRNLEPDKVYPKDRGEVHAEGLIIGSTFWDLYKDLKAAHGEEKAKALAINYAFKMIPAASRYTEVYDALLVIDDDNGNLTDKTPNYCIINKNFAAHGLATSDSGCDLASVDDLSIDDNGGNGNGAIDPGESVNLWVTARNAGASEATNLTGRLTASGPSGVSVTRGDLKFGNVPARQTKRSQNPAVLNVGASVACGANINAAIELNSGGRTVTLARTLTVGRLDGAVSTEEASGLPVAIRDNRTTKSTVAIGGEQWSGGTKVKSARLQVSIEHAYIGDLKAALVAPNGTRKEVWKGAGSGDTANLDIDVSAAFAGVAGLGTWTLEVSDGETNDEGRLLAYSLTLTPARFVCE